MLQMAPGRRAPAQRPFWIPAAQGRKSPISDPAGEKENQADPGFRTNTIQVPLSGINKKRDHGPIMARDGGPRNQMPAR